MSKLNLGDSLILDTDYSTSEVKTGATWIDGKPIYRKVYTGNLSGSQNTSFNSNTTIADVIDLRCIIIGDSGHAHVSLGGYLTANANGLIWYDNSSSKCYIGVGSQYQSAAIPYTFIAEYTKTTD